MVPWPPPLADKPEEARFDPRALQRAYDLLRRYANEGSVPGGVAVVGSGRAVLTPFAFGEAAWEPVRRPAHPHTLYDCASLTKVVVTTTLALNLMDEGRLRLDDPLVEFIPAFGSGPPWPGLSESRKETTVRDLLTHTSGLPAWAPLYEMGRNREEVVSAICRTPFKYAPGNEVVYSCLGFILLGVAIEQIAGEPLDLLARKRIFTPLGMEATGYHPTAAPAHIAPTEKKDGVIIHGEVHDENARAMGGVSGNAGIFSTGADLARFAYLLLITGHPRTGGRKAPVIVSPAALATATRNQTLGIGEPRGLGWLLKAPKQSSAGDFFSPVSYGHTGFTGTSLWIDPQRDMFAVLLTNRVHPTRENTAHTRLRPLFHNAVAAAYV